VLLSRGRRQRRDERRSQDDEHRVSTARVVFISIPVYAMKARINVRVPPGVDARTAQNATLPSRVSG
jgi:hypothetical protein